MKLESENHNHQKVYCDPCQTNARKNNRNADRPLLVLLMIPTEHTHVQQQVNVHGEKSDIIVEGDRPARDLWR